MSKQGTGDEYGRVDLGPIGVLIVEDDGHNDLDVEAYVMMPTGDSTGLKIAIQTALKNSRITGHELMDLLDSLEGGTKASTRVPVDMGRQYGEFACDTCHRTWPGRKNKTPDKRTDTCPECYEQ